MRNLLLGLVVARVTSVRPVASGQWPLELVVTRVARVASIRLATCMPDLGQPAIKINLNKDLKSYFVKSLSH